MTSKSRALYTLSIVKGVTFGAGTDLNTGYRQVIRFISKDDLQRAIPYSEPESGAGSSHADILLFLRNEIIYQATRPNSNSN